MLGLVLYPKTATKGTMRVTAELFWWTMEFWTEVATPHAHQTLGAMQWLKSKRLTMMEKEEK